MGPRSGHDFSSPQIRVRGQDDFRRFSNQRLRLPNERPPMGPRVRQFAGALITVAALAAIGIGVYFGVSALLEDDASSEVVSEQPVAPAESDSDADGGDESAATQAEGGDAAQETPDEGAAAADSTQVSSDESSADGVDEPSESGAASMPDDAETVDAQDGTGAAAETIPVSAIEPSVADEPITPAQIGGAETVTERAIAEPIPSGIPRTLQDGAAYDPTEPATAFSSRWPIGATLRLTRLPGATLLSDEEQELVVGAETLVVVRATQSSNTDLQLSPAAFDRIAVYGAERVIAVRVEVTAPPP